MCLKNWIGGTHGSLFGATQLEAVGRIEIENPPLNTGGFVNKRRDKWQSRLRSQFK
jgi:hypothetical protein